MSIANYCQTNNVFPVDSMANLLIKSFCSCPSVEPILDSIGSSTSIFVEIGDFPHHRIGFDPQVENEATIEIPEKNLKNQEALSNLAFEIFNAKGLKQMQNIYQEAVKGDMCMEEFSRKIEAQEFLSKEGYDKLIKDCQHFFKIKPEPGKPDLDVQMWNHEINCHTDKIRSRWIQNNQKVYCQKHPEDLESCKIKQKDLCDFYKLHNMPFEKQKQIQRQRICEKLPKASSKIKEFYRDKPIENMCRQILNEEL